MKRITFTELETRIEIAFQKKLRAEKWILKNNVMNSEDELQIGVDKLVEHGSIVEEIIKLNILLTTSSIGRINEIEETIRGLEATLSFIDQIPFSISDTTFEMMNDETCYNQSHLIRESIWELTEELVNLKVNTVVEIEE